MTRDELLLAIEQAVKKELEQGLRAHIQYNDAGCAALLRMVNDAIDSAAIEAVRRALLARDIARAEMILRSKP